MKIKKICTVLTIIFVIITIFSTVSYGWDWSSIKGDAKNFINKGKNQTYIDEDDIESNIMPAARILMGFGSITAVIVTLVIGIKYMMAASNPEEQAKLKKQLIGVVVSIIVIFGAYSIWVIANKFMEGIS